MSDIATLSLLGYGSRRYFVGRGYLEALGVGVKPRKDELYIRGNFATVDENLKILDRRAGREEFGLDELARALRMKIDSTSFRCIHSRGHRCVVIARGQNLSEKVSDADVGGEKPAVIRALTKRAEKTALLLNVFADIAHELLKKHPINKKRKHKANYILLRGAAKMRRVPSFRKKFKLNAIAIAGVLLIKGIARYIGIDFLSPKGANGHVNTNLKSKVKAVLRAARKYELVILHINGADEASHDKNPKLKQRFIERVDCEVIGPILENELDLVVVCDHITNSRTGEHEYGATPFLIYSQANKFASKARNFSEQACRRSGIEVDDIFRFAMRKLGYIK